MQGLNLPKRTIVLIMISLMISLLLAALDSTIVGTAMPKIISDLKGMEHYSLPFTVYILLSTVAILIFGKLSDIYGRKAIFIIGIVTFLAASMLCGLSHNMFELILFRGFQGLGAGILISNVFIIVGELFPPAQRGKYVGIVASMFALSSVIGPSIGGFITDHLNWRWVFYVNIPLGIIALTFISIVLPYVRNKDVKEIIDFKGILFFLLAVIPLFLALSWGGTVYHWISLQCLGMFAFSGIMIVVFILVERKAEEPMLDMKYFRKSIFNISSIIVFLSNAVMFCGIIYVPLFVQGVLGRSATQSGMITTPMSLSIGVTSILGGQLISRLGKYKFVALVSCIISLIGVVLLSTVGDNTSTGLVLLYASILGLGVGGLYPVFNVAAQNVFEHRELGSVTASLAFFRNMGASVGIAILGSVLKSSMAQGFKTMQPNNLPKNLVALLENTRALSDSKMLDGIRSHMPSKAIEAFNSLVFKSKSILAVSIHKVFLVTIVFAVFSLVVTFLLKEVPLRHHNYGNDES